MTIYQAYIPSHNFQNHSSQVMMHDNFLLGDHEFLWYDVCKTLQPDKYREIPLYHDPRETPGYQCQIDKYES